MVYAEDSSWLTLNIIYVQTLFNAINFNCYVFNIYYQVVTSVNLGIIKKNLILTSTLNDKKYHKNFKLDPILSKYSKTIAIFQPIWYLSNEIF